MQFIDIHTHSGKNDYFSIINLFPEEVNKIEKDKYYSLGLHPWEISNVNIDKQLSIIKEYADVNNIIAIGEIGLDKYKDAFELQHNVFLKQIQIAEEHNKPVIVHCVKAYSELLSVLKEKRLSIPVIIHRYSGNKTVAEQLMKFGCYLSFGHELFNTKSKVQRVFNTIPVEHLFLETDDSDKDIKQIYQKASEIKNLEIEILIKAINTNFENCFK
ncbi:MAG: TatD family hydrolase [Bacteroidales bacterium]|nr:TatD family hydrolase [Bacteroidales bacterium]